jgi:hypothetical protein
MKRTVLFFGLLVLCAIPVYGLSSETTRALLFGNIAQLTGLVFMFTSYMRLGDALPRNHPSRSAARQFAFGVFIWILGQSLEMYCELVLKMIAYGTIADAFWVIGYFPMYAAFRGILEDRKRDRNIAGWNYLRKLMILAAVAYAILFYFLILPQLRESSQPMADTILDFLYPTLDFLLIVQCLAIAITSQRGNAFFLFSIITAAGVLLTMVGDAVLSVITDFHSIAYLSVDVYYFTSYFVMAAAADLEWQRRKKREDLSS